MAASPKIGHPSDVGSAAFRASELAERQFGAIARRQLLAFGIERGRIASWVRTGRLNPRHPGVYAYGRRKLSTEGELAAALLVAGPGAALGGLTALWWLELLGRRPDKVHLDGPRRCAPRPGLAIREVQRGHRTWHRGLPVAPLPQALLSAAGSLTHDSLRLVLARAEFRGLLDLAALQSELGPGRSGSTALRAAMAAHLPQLAACTNQFEIDFVLLCEAYSVPLPEPSVRIGRYRPDMLWRSQGLVVELDGHDAHHTPAQLATDQRREEELRARGYTILRFTWDQVHGEPAMVAAEVRAHLG